SHLRRELPLLAGHFGHHGASQALTVAPPAPPNKHQIRLNGLFRCSVGEPRSADALRDSRTCPRLIAAVDVELLVAVEKAEQLVYLLPCRLDLESQLA